MRCVYAHFPINLNIIEDGKKIEVRNYIGQKNNRLVTLRDGVIVKPSGNKDEIYVEGNDIESVSNSGEYKILIFNLLPSVIFSNRKYLN